MNNAKYIQRFAKDLFKVDDFPKLDSYGTKIFSRKIRHSWKIFRYIANHAQEDIDWKWDNEEEVAYYGIIHVPTYAIFCTLMAHECAHGWCYFHSPFNRSEKYPDKTGEEEVAWDVSRLVCKRIGVVFAHKIADLAYEITELDRKKQTQKADLLVKQMPHYIWPSNKP